MLEKGRPVFEALIRQGVIADWLEPNVIRVAPVPLYNTFEEVWKFGEIVKQTISGIWSIIQAMLLPHERKTNVM